MKYAAHLIMAVKFEDAGPERFPLYENVVLVYADNDDEALEKARRLGKREEDESEAFRWDGRPARWCFAGVRKVIECRTPGRSENRIGPGTEITYSQMVVKSEEDLRKLVEGEPVQVFYEE